MSVQGTSAASALQDSSAGRTVAIARNDAFALPILFAYAVLMLPLLVLRVVAVAMWRRLTHPFRLLGPSASAKKRVRSDVV